MVENQIKVPMKDLQGYMTEADVISFFGVLKGLRDQLLFRLLYKTGRRVSEIISLKVNDIDWNLGMINYHILKKKDRDYRAMKPIDTITLRRMREYIEDKKLEKDDYLFMAEKRKTINNKGQSSMIICPHLSRKTVFWLMRKYCKKAGIGKIGHKMPHPHHWRHTFAVRMAQKMQTPAHVRKLQKLMEHSNLGITETYLQFNQEDMRELVEMDDII